MSRVFEVVADWADRRGVDYSIYRDGGEWTMQIRLSDALGPFLEFFPLNPESKASQIDKALDSLCHAARKKRINGGDPAYGKA